MKIVLEGERNLSPEGGLSPPNPFPLLQRRSSLSIPHARGAVWAGWGAIFLWGSMFGKGKAYPALGGERGMGQGWYGAIGKLAIAALLIGAVLIWRAEAWLHVDVPLEHADIIVVLGGESGQRVIGAAEMYHQGVAPKVFVTGSGDGRLIVRRLGMAGVPDAACESQSRSTYENAVLTKKALEASHPRSVMLVTSWFHSRRALAVFRDVWPEVAFGVHPVYAGATFTARFRIYEMGYIFSEYVKTLWYMVRYGIV